MSNEIIHYSFSLSLTFLTSEGMGDCGEHGKITGYWGLVKGCKKCKRIIEREKKEIAKINKQKEKDNDR